MADFKLFTEAKLLFKSKLTEVDDTVDKIIRRDNLNRLEQEFGTPEHPIFSLGASEGEGTGSKKL